MFRVAVNMGVQDHLPLIAVAVITAIVLFVMYRDLQRVKGHLYNECSAGNNACHAPPGGPPATAAREALDPRAGPPEDPDEETDPDEDADDEDTDEAEIEPEVKPALKPALKKQ